MSENHHATKKEVNGVIASGNNCTEDVTSKRKKNQISINDYFSKKRRKMSTSADKQEDGSEKKRDILASAAEKRLTKQLSETFMGETEAEKRLAEVTKEVIKSPDQVKKSVHDSKESDHSSTSFLDNQPTAKVQIPVHFNRTHLCSDVLPAMVPSDQHSIMFRPHIMSSKIPRPFPETYKDRWDKYHVRMPCSPENLYPTSDKKIQKRWELIEATLLQPFRTSHDLEEAILVYNHHYRDKWNFESWHSYCNIQLKPSEREELFETLLPSMVNLALQLPSVVTTPPKLLKQGVAHTVTFSQNQVACLLANAFFCTYPRRNSLKSSEFSSYPDINFSKLFRGIKDVVSDVKTEKLKTILNYFRRVLTDMPAGTVTYARQVLSTEDTPSWESCTGEFMDLSVSSEGTIEDNAEGLLQVDFANRMIGGGVVSEGCVQEEIRFLVCPELILARLFTEKLEPNESLLVTGIERYSLYSGYAQTFKYRGPHIDFIPRDRWGRRYTQVVAIDAHVFHCFSDQLKTVSMKRELDKAYSGFVLNSLAANQRSAIATGNWGCGAFGGDVYLKSLLQLMAASVAKRDIVYFTFGDETFTKELHDMHVFLRTRNITIKQLWHYLVRYGKEIKHRGEHVQLFPYIMKLHCDYTSETDDEANSSCNGDNPLEIRGVPCEIPEEMKSLSPDYMEESVSPEYMADTP